MWFLLKSPHSRHTLAALGFSANFFWTLLTCSATGFRFLPFFFFFEADGLSKHVVLFEIMEEEVVTIGFVWRQHTRSASAPPPPRRLRSLNDSPPPAGKGHSLLFFRECLPWKPPFWNKTTALPWKRPLHFFCQVCIVSWPFCLSLSISHRNTLGFQEHKIETKFDGISAHYNSTCSTEGLEFNTIWHNTLSCGALKVCRIPRCSAPDLCTHVSALPVWKKPRKAGELWSPSRRAQPACLCSLHLCLRFVFSVVYRDCFICFLGNRKTAGLRSKLKVTFWGFRCVSQADLVERAMVFMTCYMFIIGDFF